MKTQYYTASSLDGFIADDNNSLEWLFQFPDNTGSIYESFFKQVGAVAMGSTTYEWVLNHLASTPDAPLSWPYDKPTWIFTSRNLPTIEGADIRFVQGNVKAVFDTMASAAGDKNIWIAGGGDLVGQFHDEGLLDELIIFIASVTLGSGAPLLPRKIVSPPLELVSAKAHGKSFVEVRYRLPKP